MKWPSWEAERARIEAALKQHSANRMPLPGITSARACATLALQFVASLRRERYYELVQKKLVDESRADPNHRSEFDAERAVAYHVQQGNVDEAAWLIFLMTHFARPADNGWLRLRDVYGRLGTGIWDWETVRKDPARFTRWVEDNASRIGGKFGNHRKYESLRADAKRPLRAVVENYFNWIGSDGHQRFFSGLVQRAGNDPHIIFDHMYQTCSILSFGRLAKFDYLSLLARYKIAPIEAGSAYLDGATGPARGAHLLFEGSVAGSFSNKRLQACLDELDRSLAVGMTVMEDALCNWQKSPEKFVHFTG